MKKCNVYCEIEKLMIEYRERIEDATGDELYYYQVKLDALYELQRRLKE